MISIVFDLQIGIGDYLKGVWTDSYFKLYLLLCYVIVWTDSDLKLYLLLCYMRWVQQILLKMYSNGFQMHNNPWKGVLWLTWGLPLAPKGNTLQIKYAKICFAPKSTSQNCCTKNKDVFEEISQNWFDPAQHLIFFICICMNFIIFMFHIFWTEGWIFGG